MTTKNSPVRHDVIAAGRFPVATPLPGRAESLADTVEWLFLVFEHRLGLTTVLGVVHECCRELDIDAQGGAVSRLEPMAYGRLTGLVAVAGAGPAPEPKRLPSRTGPRPTRAPLRSWTEDSTVLKLAISEVRK